MLSTKKIIYKIINLFGASTSTLTTTSKTIVGAINEVDGDIGTINGNISTISNSINTINGNITTINGNITTINSTLAKKQNICTGYGTLVDISSYNSSGNRYTAPSDRMVKVYCRYPSGNSVAINISNSDGSNEYMFQLTSAGIGHLVVPFPIFKGQKVYVSTNNGTSNAIEFFPFTTA